MRTKINQKDDQGLWQGLWKHYWYNSKNLMCKGSFLNDKRIGLWEWYYENGKLWMKGSFLEDKEIGTWKEYNKKGILVEVTYHH